ncbi:hypothetical protein H9L39_08927 [Fusarium oxysporum f. sp. albedinis]|nr:hypothetical protein H9L39_08927 [Fusarium oxysporum f. sp. albedinis]
MALMHAHVSSREETRRQNNISWQSGIFQDKAIHKLGKALHEGYFNCTSSADAGGTFEDVCVKRTKRLSIERRDILKPIARC